MEINKIYKGDCLEIMPMLLDKSIDLTVTSPPYDNLRTYNGNFAFNFEGIAKELFRITKDGGVIVWIIGDETVNGSESGTSFKSALYFKEIGFNLHDTMIWNKGGFSAVGALSVRYASVFEYMFVLSKGSPKTFNPLKDKKTKHGGIKCRGTIRQKDGSTKPMSKIITINEYGQRFNIWEQPPHKQTGGHPAPFPLQLVKDHILSWSNENDTVLDCFAGSGTTAIACIQTNRNYILIEKDQEYCRIARKRIHAELKRPKRFFINE